MAKLIEREKESLVDIVNDEVSPDELKEIVGLLLGYLHIQVRATGHTDDSFYRFYLETCKHEIVVDNKCKKCGIYQGM